ncbi:Zinc finger BED domain-containing protein 5 [Trichinella spiralis]|uniref:Zinc finger BED domain-containing protein 5 n=1 Tax=Trichinella spiralis TaxID=6334 RepID=A0A0V1BTH4_TRISP|nr:Zinc finger BED domain-containing protein 5 [Trichinella spiralis]
MLHGLTAAFIEKHWYQKLSDDLKNVLNTAVKIINFIKSKPLQSRLFEKLSEEMGSCHKSLLFHSEVRWLSRGKVLTRLVELREEVAIFLKGQSDYSKVLRDEKFILKLTYLADIFST